MMANRNLLAAGVEIQLVLKNPVRLSDLLAARMETLLQLLALHIHYTDTLVLRAFHVHLV